MAAPTSGSPTFDVHGYSGCPLRVFHAPSWKIVLDAVGADDLSSAAALQQREFAHSRYFVEKVSESVSYNGRLLKQANKQLLFFQKIAGREHDQKSPSADALPTSTSDNDSADKTSTTIVIPPLLVSKQSGVAERIEQQQQHQSALASSSASSPAPLLSLVMPFVHHTDSLRFLCSADMNRISLFEARLKSFMQWMVNASPMKQLPLADFLSKITELRTKCNSADSLLSRLPLSILAADEETTTQATVAITRTIGQEAVALSDELARFFSKPDIASLQIPLGMCHGDLTLSNILVQESTHDRIVLIDFLDSFVETPLADMAKLNQDLSHGWTIRMLRKRDPFIDPVRLYILFHRMMKRIVLQPFGKFDWFRLLFRPMCVVSQMRVLQYSRDESVARYLWGTIEEEVRLWKRGE